MKDYIKELKQLPKNEQQEKIKNICFLYWFQPGFIFKD